MCNSKYYYKLCNHLYCTCIDSVFFLILEKFSVLPPSLQKQSSISGSVSLPALSAFTQAESKFDPPKKKISVDVTDGKEMDGIAKEHSSLPFEQRRPSKQLEHLFHVGSSEALLEEKRLKEEQKLKEYKAAAKEVKTVMIIWCMYFIILYF